MSGKPNKPVTTPSPYGAIPKDELKQPQIVVPPPARPRANTEVRSKAYQAMPTTKDMLQAPEEIPADEPHKPGTIVGDMLEAIKQVQERIKREKEAQSTNGGSFQSITQSLDSLNLDVGLPMPPVPNTNPANPYSAAPLNYAHVPLNNRHPVANKQAEHYREVSVQSSVKPVEKLKEIIIPPSTGKRPAEAYKPIPTDKQYPQSNLPPAPNFSAYGPVPKDPASVYNPIPTDLQLERDDAVNNLNKKITRARAMTEVSKTTFLEDRDKDASKDDAAKPQKKSFWSRLRGSGKDKKKEEKTKKHKTDIPPNLGKP